jgi:hypothetical protein
MTAAADAITIRELVTSKESPACLPLRLGNPNRLINFLEMLKFQAEHFCRASSLLGQFYMDVKNGKSPVGMSWEVIASELGLMEKLCVDLSLTATLAQIRRVKKLWFEGNIERVGIQFFAQQVIEIQTRLNDELAAEMIVILKPRNAEYFTAFSPDTGNLPATELEQTWVPVFKAFPSIKYDTLESLKSYALGRNTAAVFHLMRVLEIGLGTLGSVFGVSLAHTNWGPAIDQIESKIRDMHKDPVWKALPDCKDQQEFYSQSASHFGVLKDAWRNYTAHARGKYDEQEASDVMTSVRAFMQKLTDHGLHE